LDLLPGRYQEPLPMFDIEVSKEGSDELQMVRHVSSNPGQGYVIRVSNRSNRHVACSVTVDGENALLRDGSLIVAPHDSRELPGFLVAKNFVGREYVKEYRNFVFGKPQVVESNSLSTAGGAAPSEAEYVSYGTVICDVYDAVLDEEVDSDQDLRGQNTYFRGAGKDGSYDQRKVPEGKKKHMLYSSVTVQGSAHRISNSTRGRWWVRGTRKIKTLEVRYREVQSLMLLGVDPRDLGLMMCKDEDMDGIKKEEDVKKEDEKDFKDFKDKKLTVEVCDLTEESCPSWSVNAAAPTAEPVDP